MNTLDCFSGEARLVPLGLPQAIIKVLNRVGFQRLQLHRSKGGLDVIFDVLVVVQHCKGFYTAFLMIGLAGILCSFAISIMDWKKRGI